MNSTGGSRNADPARNAPAKMPIGMPRTQARMKPAVTRKTLIPMCDQYSPVPSWRISSSSTWCGFGKKTGSTSSSMLTASHAARMTTKEATASMVVRAAEISRKICIFFGFLRGMTVAVCVAVCMGSPVREIPDKGRFQQGRDVRNGLDHLEAVQEFRRFPAGVKQRLKGVARLEGLQIVFQGEQFDAFQGRPEFFRRLFRVEGHDFDAFLTVRIAFHVPVHCVEPGVDDLLDVIGPA